jgi:Ca2+:H+ antiporter
MPGIDTIKRAARKEAWYGDSYNPFRKTMRSNTFGGQSSKDLEAGRGVDDGSQLSEVRTEPLHYGSRQLEQPAQIRPSKEEEHRIEKANEPTSSRPSDPESDTAILEKRSTRHPSQEEKARRRFISTKFFKHGKAEELAQEGDDVEKKRPWYKGKILPHKQPFTIKNQLQATIFNSWINILLIAAPAGIALNYAGVDKKAVFAVNFIAIIPLAGLLSFATEEIALHVGESLGGLLNASFG